MVKGGEFAVKLCQVFGLDAGNVLSIDIMAEGGGVARVTIARLLTPAEAGELATLFEYYNLEKTGEYKQVHPNTAAAPPGPEAFIDGQDWNKIARQALGNEQSTGGGN